MTTDTGGPAFPNTVRIDDEAYAELRGMTLRDYFAGKALAGLVVGDEGIRPERMAALCYELADAMLKERTK